MISELLATIRGLRGIPTARPLRDLSPFEQRMTILRAKWDRERPVEPEEQEPVIVYTGLSAMAWLARTECALGRPVTTGEIIAHCAGVKHPTALSCRRFSQVLRRFGAKSTKEKGQTHLRWSSR